MPDSANSNSIRPLHKDLEVMTEVRHFLNVWNSDNETIEQQTSGSTGKPKTIKIPKRKMKNSAQMTGDFFKLKNCESALLCMSPTYIGGKMMIVRSLLFNLTLYVTKVTSNPLQEIHFPIDFVAMVPLQVEETLQNNPEKLNLITYLIIGGAPVSDELIEHLKEYSCQAYSTFGMTETISHIALRNLKSKNEPYRTIGNTEFSTVDDCLVINSEELQLQKLKTTDVVELLDKNSFYWLGRADFTINSGGVKIRPEEVERKIKSKCGITDFIIASLPDQKLGERVVFIGEQSIQNTTLKQHIESVLDKYEQPKEYFFVSSLIQTQAGKIDRNQTIELIK